MADEPKKNTSGLGPEFRYDLTDLLKVDPKLILYEESAKAPTGMASPRGIAAGPEDAILVAGDRLVRTFTKDGKTAAEFKTDGEPRCLATGKGGAVYVGMKDHVEVYGADGKRQAAWAALGEKATITCLAVGENDVFVADAGGRVVLRCDATGRLINRIGEKDDAKHAPGIIIPSPYFDVALGPEGMLWVANPGMRRVECYTYEGEFRFAWGKASPKIEGFCGCCNPSHIAIARDGTFVTSEKGLPRVKVYGAEGAFTGVVAGPASFDEGTAGLDVAVDSQGRILVLDPERREVRIFTRKKA